MTRGAWWSGYPTWSPDSQRLAFVTSRLNAWELVVRNIDGLPGEERLLQMPHAPGATDWSSDARFILFHAFDPESLSEWDLWLLKVSSGDVTRLTNTHTNETKGRLSADGSLIAYDGDKSGSSEIYVMPCTGDGAVVQVSTSGGSDSHWRRDGREIFYLDKSGWLTAVPVHGVMPVTVGEAARLFQVQVPASGSTYDVSPDGQRFLVVTSMPRDAAQQLKLLNNWREHLTR